LVVVVGRGQAPRMVPTVVVVVAATCRRAVVVVIVMVKMKGRVMICILTQFLILILDLGRTFKGYV